MTKKNACRWFSTAIIFGVNRKLTPSTNRHAHANFWKNPNTLGKIGFIKVFYKKWTELYILKIRILHLWLHFLQIIFVIFQNFCWSITWAGIRSTPLFQAIFFCSLWSPWIWILVKCSLWYLSTLKWTKMPFCGPKLDPRLGYLPLFPDPFCRRPRFFGFAGRAVFVPLSEDKYPDCRGIILTDGIVVGFCIDCMNALKSIIVTFLYHSSKFELLIELFNWKI